MARLIDFLETQTFPAKGLFCPRPLSVNELSLCSSR